MVVPLQFLHSVLRHLHAKDQPGNFASGNAPYMLLEEVSEEQILSVKSPTK